MPKNLFPNVTWHFIGNLQSNKINKLISPEVKSIHSLKSLTLLEKVNQNLQKKNLIIEGYLQVKLEDENEGKEGFETLD